MPPDGVRGGTVIRRQVFGSLSCCDHLEARGAGPVNEFANQRGLIPVGHGIDQAGLAGFRREQRAGENIGFHIDHDEVASLAYGLTGMADAGDGISRGFDDDIDLCLGDQCFGIVRKLAAGDLLV